MFSEYIQEIHALLDRVERDGKASIKKGAEMMAHSIASGGIVQLFGCGHSHILTEEVFYRAGGLAPVKAIFHEPLMLHQGAVTSSENERRNDYAQQFMKNQDIQENDVVIVISTSGKNPVPVDVAMLAKEKGAYVIGLTSSAYGQDLPRHKKGKLLCDVVDLVLDNYIQKGDAMMKHIDANVRFGSASTVIGATIINSLFIETVNLLVDQGVNPPPVFISGNVDGADKHNQKLVETYRKRIPLLS